MISYTEATNAVLGACQPLGSRQQQIREAVGYVLRSDIVSPLNIRQHRNSAMDGFAVQAEWLQDCSDDKPVSLSIAGTAFAGDPLSSDYPDHQVIKIMTGAIVPDQFDAVVKFEDTRYDERTVSFDRAVATGTNVRPPGEDICEGEVVFRAGHRLRSLDIGILASMGLTETDVCRKPNIIIAGSGNELVTSGNKLKPGQIYDSNEATMLSMLRPLCDQIDAATPLHDKLESICLLLESDADVIVTSGGVSAGERDLIVPAAEAHGWTTVFHKARIKPGKPVYFARKGIQLLFGLPGNPLSTAVTCAVFVVPALKKLAGRGDYEIPMAPASLDPSGVRKGNRLLIWPGQIRPTAGDTAVRFADKKSSAALSALIGSDGLIFQDTYSDESGPPKVWAVPWNRILEN